MQKNEVTIQKTIKHSPGVVTVFFTLPDGSVFDYVAGQYVTVYFDSGSTPAGKAYSLSSAPSESMMSITVKKIGEYSGMIHGLKKGDTMTVSEPYGHFNPETELPLVCISAGVGISPVWSIIKSDLEQNNQRELRLFYTNKTLAEVAFYDDLESLKSKHDNFKVDYYLTRDSNAPIRSHKNRIDFSDCVNQNEAFYLVCGSAEFSRSVWQGLTTQGVAADKISTEVFFEQ